MKLKIMTFNICHCMNYSLELKKNDSIDFDIAANVINECDCDIIGLNEVRGKGDGVGYEHEQAEELGKRTKRDYYFAPAISFRGGPYGNGFLSKLPIKSAEKIMVPDPLVKDEDAYYETRCIIKAVVDLGGKDITVFATHFGLAKGEQRNAVATLLKEFEKVSTPIVLMGDFNVRPDNEIIAPLYEKFNEAFAPGNEFTFPSEGPDRKIDYIFLSRDFEIKSAKVINKIASDHCAIMAEVEL